MNETIISDAFYHIHNEVFARENHCYERVFTKAGREEAIELGLYFVPDLYKTTRQEWKKIKSSLSNIVDIDFHISILPWYAFCPHFLTRGWKLVNEEEYVDYIDAVGRLAPRGVLPMHWKSSCFVMSQESADEFLRQGFTGVVSQSLVSDETNFPDEKIEASIKEMNLFYVRFRRFMGNQTFLREIRALPPRKCGRCGGSIEYCFDCGVKLADCPHCGLRGWEFYEKESDDDPFVKLWFDVSRNVPAVWFHNIHDRDNWEVYNKMHPFLGEKWSGNDFFNYGSFAVCTGRAAKWFIENQFGYIGLSPIFVNVSNCSEEQRERIEAVRYSPFRR